MTNACLSVAAKRRPSSGTFVGNLLTGRAATLRMGSWQCERGELGSVGEKTRRVKSETF